jgi:hypothetical protein
VELTKFLLDNTRPREQIEASASDWNEIVDLAVLMEPLYWSSMIGQSVAPITVSKSAFQERRRAYKAKVLEFVRTLDAGEWRRKHECLRLNAADLDSNSELYLVLRLAKWDKRETLKGSISGALWIRHLAEVIRRGFEEAHNQCWPEEDQDLGIWYPEARKWLFGAERPLDDPLISEPYLAFNYGLSTGSAVRWYVEGETEYYAIYQTLTNPAKYGIELVNLHGNIKAERDNVALKLQEWLAEDRSLHRFSMISIDNDVYSNVKAIRRRFSRGMWLVLYFCINRTLSSQTLR